MGYLTDLLGLYASYVWYVLGFLWMPRERLFVLYLLTAVGFAYAVYRLNARRGPRGALRNFGSDEWGEDCLGNG